MPTLYGQDRTSVSVTCFQSAAMARAALPGTELCFLFLKINAAVRNSVSNLWLLFMDIVS